MYAASHRLKRLQNVVDYPCHMYGGMQWFRFRVNLHNPIPSSAVQFPNDLLYAGYILKDPAPKRHWWRRLSRPAKRKCVFRSTEIVQRQAVAPPGTDKVPPAKKQDTCSIFDVH